MQDYIVYVHINKKNNKKYVGQTKLGLEKRSGNNGVGYKKCPLFWKAIQKYGWDNFEHIILKNNLTSEEANQWEKYYINLYDSTNSDLGYNLSEGGIGHSGPMSEETKQKISASTRGPLNHFYGKHHTEESIQKIKDNLPDQHGKNNPFYGKHHTEESKQKISKSKQGQGNKKVYCITTNEYFESIKIASEKYNIQSCNISKNCNKHRKSAGKHPITREKMIWCFVEEDNNEILSK